MALTPRTVTLPTIPASRLRWGVIAIGLVVFFWLRLEDNGVAVAVVMALLLTALALAAWLWPRIAGRPLSARALVTLLALTGAGLGLLTAPSAALLMLLKNGFHGHLYPDYPAGLIAATLARAPAGAVAGALLGIAAALLLWTRTR
ncbi:MAG TPA: hypothetical protein VER79_01450 [Candidatus Limnocylindrales bacterium]|nr:hypothetical protein [Candidatus Limnocylindrales bacterium]